PIGHLEKPEVRRIAKEQGLVTAEKKDSQGLCFIGKVRLPDFLQQQLKPKKGKIIEIANDSAAVNRVLSSANELDAAVIPYTFKPEDGKVVGEHSGAHYFTIGQRKGLAVGGTPEPLFVLATDVEHNIIYTGQGDSHPGLSKQGLFIKTKDIHWIREDLAIPVGAKERFEVRIRYRQKLVPATLYHEPDGLYIIFDEAQKAITPGQFSAWYQNEELVGSGVIDY
ncbi:MAG: tRNA methyl transferase PRC-barrel domain-containing protein, partial [Owenweeksia sp.]